MQKKLHSSKTIILSLSLILPLLACISTTLDTSNGSESVSSKRWSCQEKISCPSEGDSSHYMCKIPKVNGGLASWGRSKCLAEKSLKEKICANKIDPKNILRLTCIPDPNAGECPQSQGFCTFEFQPTTCRAKTYNGHPLEWHQQMIARASNPCLASFKLKEEACFAGLLPSMLGDINCEQDLTEGLCPPKYECKAHDSLSKTRCRVSNYGDQDLIPVWEASASTECEAKYAIFQKACSYANASNGLKPNTLGDISCN